MNHASRINRVVLSLLTTALLTAGLAGTARGQCVPAIIGTADTPGLAADVAVSGTVAYVADDSSGLQVLDVSDPTNPVIIGSVDTPGVAQAAIITVNTTADVVDANGGSCAGMTISDLPGIDNVTSLREAVCAANGTVGADVITFTDLGGSPDLYTLAIAGTGEDAAATGDLDITEDLTITGNGQAETIIQAGTDETNGIDRVFHVLAEATFEDVTIRHGRATGSGRSRHGGGIYNDQGNTVNLVNSTVSGNFAGNYGGGIYNEDGTLDLTNSTVSGNTANYGGGIYNDWGTSDLTNSTVSANTADREGGGIYNVEGSLDLTNSTVSGNFAGNYGGGIYNEDGTLDLTNSTVSGNTVNSDGGGIYNYIESTVNLTNSTVSGNTADRNGGGIFNYEAPATVNLINSTVSGNTATDGGGIYNYELGAVVNLTNTIVADQLAGGDCSGAVPVTSNDYNLDSDGSCNLTQPNDKPNNPSANLGPLQLNAPGNTATHALLVGSDAIDTGDCTGGTITTDQRGVPRPQGAACDMGAYEFQATTIPGNCDGDGDVDLDDYTGFEACLLGPDGGLGTGCECFDFDNDHDVDLDDFAEFQVNFTGN